MSESAGIIRTARLQLVPASLDLLDGELAGHAEFGRRLGAAVPADWPPELYDRQATEYTIKTLRDNPGSAGWWLYYIVLPGANGGMAIGTCGYKGPPADGCVEIGYGVLTAYRRRGIATEASLGLIDRAFADPGVRLVVAETLPELTASIGVMTKCGFEYCGDGSEPGVIRYELARARYTRLHGN